jgi:hypothetical protein
MTYEVIIEEFVLTCNISRVVSVKGNPNSWDSPADYHGYREMEFEIVSGYTYDEHGEREDLGKNGCAAAAERLAEEIENELWELYEDEAKCAAEDAAESRRYAGVWAA